MYISVIAKIINGVPEKNVRQAFSTLPDILSPYQTFFPLDDCQLSVVLVFHVMYFTCVCIDPSHIKLKELFGEPREPFRHISPSMTN